MKILNYFLILLLVGITTVNVNAQALDWSQIGVDIDGEEEGDKSGKAISLSDDGLVLAIGSTENGGDLGANDDAGHVRVYTNVAGTWTQTGTDIDGEAADDESGCAMSLNADGSIIAIGAHDNNDGGDEAGHVRVFQYDIGTSDWVQLGADIDGEAAGDESGFSVSLSNSGFVVAIGAHKNDDTGDKAGQVRIYTYNSVSSTWTQTGTDINGERESDEFGYSVSLSADGSIVAIGARRNDGINDDSQNDIGLVRIYTNVAGTWTQTGTDIFGEEAEDKSGTSVSLNSNGTIVAIGSPSNDGGGYNSGSVRIYTYDGVSSTWTQTGTGIDGEFENDKSGTFVSLSADGSIVAIGSNANDEFASNAGHTRIYENISGTWTQKGTDVNGEAENDMSGVPVSLSANGYTVAIGAYMNDGNGNMSGHTRVFEYLLMPTITTQPVSQTCITSDEINYSVIADGANSYQWQVSIDNGNTWADLSDDATYSGTQTYSLTITTINYSLDNNLYLCAITNVGVRKTDAVVLSFYINPVIPSLDELTDECSVTATAPTVTEGCVGDLTGTTTDPLTYTEQGTYSITWTFDDGIGNISNQTQWVIIEDITAPETPTLTDVTGECSATATAPTTNDNCAGEITGTTTDDLTYDIEGTYTITWTFADGNGNSIDVDQNVVIEDTEAPAIPTLTDVTGECSATATAPTTNDNCAGEITGTTTDDLTYTTQGTHIITWNFADDNGNNIDVTQNVVVEDITVPEITCVENQEVTAGDTEVYTVDGTQFDPISTDDNCGDVTIINNINGSATLTGATLAQGETHTIVWTVTDIAGNETECSYDVVVNNFVGISDLSEIGISIYPNPSTGIFTIETEGNFDVTITDISGKVIYSTDKACFVSTSQIDLTNHANGIYFIKFQNSEIVKTVKIIKQ